MTGRTPGAVLEVLRSLPGVHRAEPVPDDLRDRALDLEARHEEASLLPVRNLGMRLLARRRACFLVLKDGTFRSPGTPTVCLVEEDAPEDCCHLLVVDGGRYAVIGEEAPSPAGGYGEPAIPIERSFVIFPERRRRGNVPCLFVLPPVGFEELERQSARLGIGDVVSVSPSLAVDALLREAFGLPRTNELATLLVGCNPLAPNSGAA